MKRLKQNMSELFKVGFVPFGGTPNGVSKPNDDLLNNNDVVIL